MAALLARKLVQMVVVVIVVTFATTVLLNLVPPAGHVERVLVTGDPSNPIVKHRQQQLRHDLGLDKNIFVQYGKWANDFVHGDMGEFYRVSGNDPVSTRLALAYPVTLELLVLTVIVSLAAAIPLGVWSAQKAGRFADKAINGTVFAALAIPNFALGLVLAYYVGYKLNWLPPNGFTRLTDNPVDNLRTMVLPVISLSAGTIAIFQRLLRSDMIQTLQEDFVLVAKAKGISNQRVLWRHTLRPSLLTLFTVVGITLGTLVGGALAIEIVFNLPGMGTEIYKAIAARQFVALRTYVAIIAAAYVVINVVVDIAYTYLDPRVRDA